MLSPVVWGRILARLLQSENRPNDSAETADAWAMNPRGDRLDCSLRTLDRCRGTYTVHAGVQPGTIGIVEPVVWNPLPKQEVLEAVFTQFGDISMTGQIIMLNQYQWRDLRLAKLEVFFYAAIIWGKSPFKVVEDAELIVRRAQAARFATAPRRRDSTRADSYA